MTETTDDGLLTTDSLYPSDSPRRGGEGMEFLQGDDGDVAVLARGDGFDDGLRAGHRRHAGDAVLERGAADGLLVVVRGHAEWGVDDERDLALLDLVGNVGPA